MDATTLAIRSYGTFLAGRWITDGPARELRAPHDGSTIALIHEGTPQLLEEALAAAVKAFEVTRNLSSYERQRVLERMSQGISDRREEFARVIALEAGKPIRTARQEVERAVLTYRVAAEEATRITGEYMPLDLIENARGRWGLVRRFPIGVIAAITPFNFPLNLVAHKVAPAIACGCTMVLKPAPQTPISALMTAELAHQAGWPEGALSAVPLPNEQAEALVTDPRPRMLTFTGSAAVGWLLKSKAGKKRVVLELGGNAGCIVHRDADLELAAQRCVIGGFGYAGQSCISVQRIYVHREAESRFLELLVAGAKKLKVGEPLNEATDVGPMIRESDAIRAEEWVREAVAGGARMVCGGARRGSYLDPTVLTGTTREMKVNCMEVFAPVVTVEPYDDFHDAIARVNDSPYGLQAGLFTRDARLIFQAYEQIEVGGLIAGDVPTFRVDHMPYGGTKDSGLGREGVRYAIEDMTESRILVMA